MSLPNISTLNIVPDHFLVTLERIEQLFDLSNTELSVNTRMILVHQKLSEYISHTQSMLHECLLHLAESVLMQTEDEDEEEEYCNGNEDSLNESDKDEELTQ